MINNVLNNMEKLSFYDALLEGKVEVFDRVLLYTESSNLGVEYDYEEITILEVNRSIPNKIIIKYKINTGSSEGRKYWADVEETFKGYYLFSVLNDKYEKEMIFS